MTKFDQDTYFFTVASDVQRNCLGLEAWRHEPDGQHTLVAEVWYSDDHQDMHFSTFEADLPFQLIEHLASVARVRLTPKDEAAE